MQGDIMKITIYSTTTCPYCVMLKSWLQSKSVEFTDYLVDKNPIAAEHMVNLSGQMGVPFSTIEYDDGSMEKILGFDRPRFEAALTTKK
jgi:glutaredoxin 3